MAGLVSLNARRSALSESSDIVPITLVTISHPELAEPLRISTDPTERLSTDPLRYGTRHQGATYYYALISVPLPDAGDGASDTVSVTIDIVTPGMSRIPGSFRAPATVDLVVVMSDALDTIEIAYRGLETKSATVDTEAGTISLEIGLMPRMDEPTQRHRMTADRFPGLHRR